MKLHSLVLVLLLAATSARAQFFDLVGATVHIDGYSAVDNSCYDPDPCFVPSPEEDSYTANAFAPSGLGFDFGVSRGHRVSEDQDPGFCCNFRTWAHSNNFAYAAIDGIGTDFVSILYGVSAHVQCGNDNIYLGRATDTLQFTILLEIDGGPSGFPAVVDYTWDHFGGIGGRHEAFFEDSVITSASLSVDSAGNVLQNNFNYSSSLSQQFAWNKLSNQGGQFTRVFGDQLLITGRFVLDVNTNTPSPFPALSLDGQSGTQWGRVRLSLGTPIVPVPADTLAQAWLEFSVDIGGDCEMSDPTSDGNEVFDPGDFYTWLGPPLPPGGADGIHNDEVLLGLDFFPQAPDGPPPTTGAPVESGAPYGAVATAYFDMDDEDHLDFDLSQFGYGPGDPPIGRFDSPCIFDANNLFVSFEDDMPELYTAIASAPLNSPSANLFTHGQTSSADEIVGLSVFTFVAPAQVYFQYPYLTEEQLHVSLAPNPTPFGAEDDDVDGLDIRDGQCPVWYFSVDHEAVSLLGLNPGSIYMKVGGGPGGGFLEVVDPVLHLGLTRGVDVDAFEFVWAPDWYGGSGADGLALLFSVDEDDPFTPEDESSGLNPAMLYASFLNGTSFEFLNAPLEDDIDALSAWPVPLYAQYTPPPQPCLPPDDLVIFVDTANNVVTLTFTAPQDANYEVFSTTNALAPLPPGPDWQSEGSVPAIAGQVISFSITYPVLDPLRVYRIIARCP